MWRSRPSPGSRPPGPRWTSTFEVYGRGDTGPALAAQAAELGIADRVTFHGRIAIEDVPAAVAAADIGLAPRATTNSRT